MMFTKNYDNAFEFVKVIIQSIVNPDTVKTAFSMTPHLRQHYVVISNIPHKKTFLCSIFGDMLI